MMNPRERLKEGAIQLSAGGCAGLIEVCLMTPLDVVKTRMQMPDDVHKYKSITDCFKQMYKQEGPLAFYKGILPPILAETPKRATKFFAFAQFKPLLTHDDLPLPVTFTVAGFLTGITEGALICPFEVVKVRLQAEPDENKNRSAWATARHLLKRRGWQGMYLGFDATVLQHAVWNAVYFGVYHTVHNYFPAPEDSTQSFVYRFSVGFASGFLASAANIPLDVAKSRIQGPQPETDNNRRTYKTVGQTLRLVYRNEGVSALYAGFIPKVMRLAPGGAIMFVVYDAVYDSIKQRVG